MSHQKYHSIPQSAHQHIPYSVIKTSRDECYWQLEIHQQPNKRYATTPIPIDTLPIANLPDGLHGYAFIVGALFQSQNKPQENGTQLYTGDGMVYRLGFENGQAFLKTRIAKTPCYYADPATQFYLADYVEPYIPFINFKNKILSYFVKKYPVFSYFSAFRNGGPSRFSLVLGSRNQLNTAFLKTRDHLLLTMDAGRAYQLDPDSMELLKPVGSTKEWLSIFPVISRLTWINTFETYISSAHYVIDINSTKGQSDELFTTNYSTGYNGKFKKIVNRFLDSIWFRYTIRLFYALLGKKFNSKRELGRFTHLIRYRFADEQKNQPETMERWQLVLPNGQPLLVNQSLHQLAITEKYIILADIAFKMEFSQIFSPFIFGFLKLCKSGLTYPLGALIYAIFLREIKPLPFANLYIVNRQDLEKHQQKNDQESIPDDLPSITVQQVRLPREISHFTADYSNPDQKITLHVGHVNGWDVTEWITHYDQPVPGKPFRHDLEGMMVGSTDLGSLGRYVIDGATGKIENAKTVQDIQSTWALSLYTHRDINRDSFQETTQEVKNIYWLSLGFTWELIPQRIYEAYKSDPRRVVPVKQLPNDNKPITILRLDTQRMEIVDFYQFPSGSYVSSIQFAPSSLPCPQNIDESIHGFIICTVMLDPEPSHSQSPCQSQPPRDEFWIFHADGLGNKPIYRLCANSEQQDLNLAMTIHSTWLTDIPQKKYSVDERCQIREESVKEDYQHLIDNNKCRAVRELFNEIVFPRFKEQTLERDFEKILCNKYGVSYLNNHQQQDSSPTEICAKKTKMYSFQDWRGGARSLKQEFDYLIDDVEGEIPLELNGTLFRNGPGLLDVNGQGIHHPWDGDGMICAITFHQGKARFRNRFITTEGYLAERTAQKILYRGVFGTQKPGGWLANAFDVRLKNVANTQVISWGGKLLALWEAANPYHLDPMTLETLGIETFNGLLRKGSPIAAHPKVDLGNSTQDPRLVAFAVNACLISKIHTYELDITGTVVQHLTHQIPGFVFIHDFAITPNYCLFFQPPVSFNPLPYLFGFRGAAECIQLKSNQPTRIWIIPRHPGLPMQVINTDSCFVFHHGNAFEQGEQIIVDSVCYEDYVGLDHRCSYPDNTNFEQLPPGQLWRFNLNLKTKSATRTMISPQCVEFPHVSPERIGQPHRWIFLGAADQVEGNAPLQSIVKINPESGEKEVWSAAPRGFVGEPVFIPRARVQTEDSTSFAEDDGWVITLVYDAASQRTDVVILDGKCLSQGPIARLHLKHHVPYGLHGTFSRDVISTIF